jgi:hypothetical protein
MSIRFLALPTAVVRSYQSGAQDAYGRDPERRVSDGSGLPCRHCLEDIEAGEEYLVLAYRPFRSLQPYAETGPIYLHARECSRHPARALPGVLATRLRVLLRGYRPDERIAYGTGALVETDRIVESASAILRDPEVSFVDVRSATSGCFQFRIERAEASRAA